MTDHGPAEAAHALFSAVIESTSDVVHVQDLDDRYVVINSRGAALLGKTVEQVVGKKDSELFNPEEAATREEENAVVVRTGETVTREVREQFGGEERLLESSKRPYRDASGTCVGVITIGRDITETRLAEQTQGRGEGRARIDTLTACVAHSLNNALTPIMGMAELILLDPTVPHHVAPKLETILRHATGAADLVRHLQRLSAADTDQDSADAVGINEIWARVIASAGDDWADKGIQLEQQLDEAAGAVANTAEIRQAFTHVLINAVEAMPDGGTLTIRTKSDGANCLIHIVDTGVGMTIEEQARCRQPFYSTKQGRPGLGLSVAYGAAKRAGGSLLVESHSGRGTSVEISLPTRAVQE
jgi:PAS domain S-box-containing protein